MLDPRRDIRACTGAVGQPVADGLLQAWEDNLPAAVKTLTRAIEAGRKPAQAYLNRALAYQLQGHGDRALADLDRAIDSDPGSAAAYFHRSVLLRSRGENARAEADAKRAIALDPRYRGVLR